MDNTLVVVGGSHAGAELATTARKCGWKGRIIIVSEEQHLPYHRPPLSKTYLTGDKSIGDILIKPEKTYEKAEVEFLLGVRVESINRDGKSLSLSNGEHLRYEKLALATGARPRKIPVPGAELSGIHYLRHTQDVDQLRPLVQAGSHAIIVGGGYIGLETAAALRSAGMEVTVIETLPRVLARVAPEAVSQFYTRIHQEEGVNIVVDTSVESFRGDTTVEEVVCSDGNSYSADLVIVGIGVMPNVELAEAAGLETRNGIVVDSFGHTSDPDIVAAGDVTSHQNPIYGREIRLESVQNAKDQSRVAAETLCGDKREYHALPWFWSDQYDLKLQIAGLSSGADDVLIRGDIENSRSFAAFYFKENRLLAVDAVNRPKEFMLSKRLITNRQTLDKDGLESDSVSLEDLVME